jgi:hypothetical protein
LRRLIVDLEFSIPVAGVGTFPRMMRGLLRITLRKLEGASIDVPHVRDADMSSF